MAQVTVALGEGAVMVGQLEVDDSGPEDQDAEARAAAVAWNALTRNAVFTVNGKRFTATECAEWWA